ncbi:MAG TPA: hypothetical protein VMZ30_11770 [Pyrinomonadaceae bacterium]|nr:hypothetical protein [Pyrinomonadaceae bacterium]
MLSKAKDALKAVFASAAAGAAEGAVAGAAEAGEKVTGVGPKPDESSAQNSTFAAKK